MRARVLGKERLGESGLEVSSFGLGTAALAASYGPPGREREAADRDLAFRVIGRAVEAGVNFIDTAPTYGEAERWVGEVVGPTSCVIATKLLSPSDGWLSLDEAAVRSAVRSSVESSLAALRRDRVDLLQVHNADVDLLERGHVVKAMEELREEGLIELIGASVYGNANALAAVQSSSIDVVQVAYSALDRRPDQEVIPLAGISGTSVIARSVLLRGVLSVAGRDLGAQFAPLQRAADAFREAMGATWTTLPGAAAAWATTKPGLSCVLLGPRDDVELEELLAGAGEFLDAARSVGDHWHADLPAELLDPTRWPELEADG